MDPSDTDPDMALEKAVQNLEIGSDSEAEETETIQPERSEDLPGKLLEEGDGNSGLTREKMSRLYSSSPASSTAPSAVSDSSQLRQPVTLDTVIQDSRLFHLFRLFLKDQCTTRNLNFWLTCEHYRKQIPSDGQQYLYEMAMAIYIKFIKGSATQRVNLLDQTKKHIKMALELKQRVTPDLFLSAQKEICEVMNKNELRQFLVSGIGADCPGFANLADNISVTTSVYTPSMANPALGVCGGGSLQHSGSEDSASVSSFSTESDMGPRSCVMQLSRPFPTAARNAVSDCEDHKPRSSNRRGGRHHSAYATKDKPVTQERFAALVQDRLAAVIKDREAMTKKVRERARQQKKNYEEIMALEWYDLPEAVKFVQYDKPSSMGRTGESSSQLQIPFAKPAVSPLSTPRKDLNHINGLALREVQAALKDMEITNQVSEARRPFSRNSGCSSVMSTTSDSGVGDTLANSGLVTPQQDRLKAFLYHQNSISSRTSERERDARAAAYSLIHASPQPESLNPRVSPMRSHPSSERHSRRPYSNYPEAYSSDDSSSCFTMTSHSSASDLFFVPKRTPHRPAYSDNDESHHFGSSRYHRRPLAQPRRSNKSSSHMAPSPIVEHQQLASPASSVSSSGPIKEKGHSGQTMVVYHLDQIPTPFATRIPETNISLRDFKDKVLKRPGNFRYFFKSYLEDVGEYLEECSDDGMVLPLFQGKIIGRVERID